MKHGTIIDILDAGFQVDSGDLVKRALLHSSYRTVRVQATRICKVINRRSMGKDIIGCVTNAKSFAIMRQHGKEYLDLESRGAVLKTGIVAYWESSGFPIVCARGFETQGIVVMLPRLRKGLPWHFEFDLP